MAPRTPKPTKRAPRLSAGDAARAEATLAHGARAFDEAKLAEVLEDGQTVEAKTRHLGGVVEEVKLLWRLLADYARGRYRAPWRFIAAVGFAFLYLILPTTSSDFLPGLLPRRRLRLRDGAARQPGEIAAYQGVAHRAEATDASHSQDGQERGSGAPVAPAPQAWPTREGGSERRYTEKRP